MRTRLSHPALAKRFTLASGAGCCPGIVLGWGAMSEPGCTAGAHDTALHPIACPSKTSAPHWPSSGARGAAEQGVRG